MITSSRAWHGYGPLCFFMYTYSVLKSLFTPCPFMGLISFWLLDPGHHCHLPNTEFQCLSSSPKYMGTLSSQHLASSINSALSYHSEHNVSRVCGGIACKCLLWIHEPTKCSHYPYVLFFFSFTCNYALASMNYIMFKSWWSLKCWLLDHY